MCYPFTCTLHDVVVNEYTRGPRAGLRVIVHDHRNINIRYYQNRTCDNTGDRFVYKKTVYGGAGFDSRSLHCQVTTWARCSHSYSSVTKQYNYYTRCMYKTLYSSTERKHGRYYMYVRLQVAKAIINYCQHSVLRVYNHVRASVWASFDVVRNRFPAFYSVLYFLQQYR